MRIMSSESSIAQEKDIYKELPSVRVKITNLVKIFCKYLFNSAIKHGRYYYPSLNTFKFDEKLSLSSRTIDRLVLSFIEFGILIKLPRSNTQSYRVKVNNPLFRFIMSLFQPHHEVSLTQKHKVDSTRIEKLQDVKEHLQSILDCLKSKDDYLSDLREDLLNELTDNFDLSDSSKDEIKDSFKSIIRVFSEGTSVTKIPTLNDFLQDNKGD